MSRRSGRSRVAEYSDHDGPRNGSSVKYTIADIIPPRPGSRLGTIVFDPAEKPPIESITVRKDWLRATHARVGARVSFVQGGWLRYWWEELPEDLRKVGLMDELYPRKSK